MRKVNVKDVPDLSWSSPKGKFGGSGKQISEALGRKPQSTDLFERHPFDIELLRLSPGQTPYPYHSHSLQWEFYHVIYGHGKVRDADGLTPIEEGDAFIFLPGQAHQILNDSSDDLVVYVIADNPIGESNYFPDSGKYIVRSPERTILRSEPLDYFDGEE